MKRNPLRGRITDCLRLDIRSIARFRAGMERERYRAARRKLAEARALCLSALSRYPMHFEVKYIDGYAYELAEVLALRRAYFDALRVARELGET